jgi:hypothetical protein
MLIRKKWLFISACRVHASLQTRSHTAMFLPHVGHVGGYVGDCEIHAPVSTEFMLKRKADLSNLAPEGTYGLGKANLEELSSSCFDW